MVKKRRRKKGNMRTFKEYMDSAKSLFGDNKDTQAKAVIRAGINLRPDFWDDFMSITNDAEGVSQLLDVPKEKVANWASLIRDMLEDVESTDSEEKGGRSEILGTGEDIEDPNGHPDHMDDLRPTP